MFWFTEQKSSFFEVSKKEQVDTIERLIEQGTMRSGYYLLLVLATLIVTPGLFLDNVSVVIGGMILAPLLVPLLSLALSLVTGNLKSSLRSLRILTMSILIVIATSALMTFVLSRTYGIQSWYPTDIRPGIYIFIAFCSGIAGAFAWIKEDLAPAIAGVATAVALLPPICVAGISLALQEFDLLKGSLIIFVSNLLGITMAAFIVFWLLGFLRASKVEMKVLEEQD